MSAQIATIPKAAAPAGAAKLPVPSRARALGSRIKALSDHQDKEFLPAHLEILDTPASPYALGFVWVMAAGFVAAILWACLAQLDIFAIASGRVQISGRSKIVQPYDAGKVKTLLVQNGDKVRAGDTLIEFEPTEAAADLEGKASQLESLEAEVARRNIQIAAVKANEATANVAFPATIGGPIRERETAVMAAELGQYIATRDSLLSQLNEKAAQQERFTSSIAARQRLMAVLKERAEMRETLVAKSAGTRAAVIDAVQLVEQTSADLAYDQGQLVEAQAGAKSLEKRLDQWSRETIATQTQKLTEASQKLDALRQDVIKARLKLDRTRLTAPIDGTVQQLAVTTIGQVVSPGQALVVVVPSDGTIEVEALVQNKDIGFLQVGQEATVKVDSFPFTRYGTIEGRVTRVSRDAIDDRDASGSTDTLSVTRSQGVQPVTGTPRTQNLVFPVTVELLQKTIMSDGVAVPLGPGMTTTVEVKTGTRRVIDYVLSPIKETVAGAAHER